MTAARIAKTGRGSCTGANIPREAIEYATSRRRFEKGHWRTEDGECHTLVQFTASL